MIFSVFGSSFELFEFRVRIQFRIRIQPILFKHIWNLKKHLEFNQKLKNLQLQYSIWHFLFHCKVLQCTQSTIYRPKIRKKSVIYLFIFCWIRIRNYEYNSTPQQCFIITNHAICMTTELLRKCNKE